MRPWGSPSQHNIIRHQAIRSSARASGDLVEAFNDTVYVQTGMPVGVPADDLTFTSLMRNGHIRTTTGQFTAGAIVSDEMRPSIVMANFNFPGAPANSVAHAVPDPVTNNYRYKLGRATLTKVGESPSKRRSPACR